MSFFFGEERAMPNYWLFKSEPETYGIERLKKEKRTEWSGVRNYQARNNMIAMQVGDLGFFYHSVVQPPGIVGICKVVKTAYPDFTALDPKSDYHDPKATPERPIWQMVDVAFERALPRLIGLPELREMKALAGMPLIQKGSRLSVQPVTPAQWKAILNVADA